MSPRQRAALLQIAVCVGFGPLVGYVVMLVCMPFAVGGPMSADGLFEPAHGPVLRVLGMIVGGLIMTPLVVPLAVPMMIPVTLPTEILLAVLGWLRVAERIGRRFGRSPRSVHALIAFGGAYALAALMDRWGMDRRLLDGRHAMYLICAVSAVACNHFTVFVLRTGSVGGRAHDR